MALERAATYINRAKKPLILAGQGILLAGAEAELADFVEKTGIPGGLHAFGFVVYSAESSALYWLFGACMEIMDRI